jgi:hypothetical protein
VCLCKWGKFELALKHWCQVCLIQGLNIRVCLDLGKKGKKRAITLAFNPTAPHAARCWTSSCRWSSAATTPCSTRNGRRGMTGTGVSDGAALSGSLVTPACRGARARLSRASAMAPVRTGALAGFGCNVVRSHAPPRGLTHVLRLIYLYIPVLVPHQHWALFIRDLVSSSVH